MATAVAVTIGLLAGLLGGAHDATAQPAPTDRFVVSVDVGWRPASRTFGSTRVFPVYAELGNFQVSHAIEKGGVIGGGVSFRLSSRKPPGCSLASGFGLQALLGLTDRRLGAGSRSRTASARGRGAGTLLFQDLDQRQRVDPGAVQPEGPVQMWTGDPAGCSGVTDHLTGLDQIPFLDEDF